MSRVRTRERCTVLQMVRDDQSFVVGGCSNIVLEEKYHKNLLNELETSSQLDLKTRIGNSDFFAYIFSVYI